MIISEKQIFKLMTYVKCYIQSLAREHAPHEFIQDVVDVLNDIENQQSAELRTIE